MPDLGRRLGKGHWSDHRADEIEQLHQLMDENEAPAPRRVLVIEISIGWPLAIATLAIVAGLVWWASA